MNPYEVMGVSKDAPQKAIKAAYRKLSGLHHPDKGGDRDRFEELKTAYDVLIDPERRKRYDETGRLTESKVTAKAMKTFIDSTMKGVVEAQRPNGSSDDPIWENIRDKIILSLKGARIEINARRVRAVRLLNRCDELISRFKPKQEDDPIGDFLREERKGYLAQIEEADDAFELSVRCEKVFLEYDYEMGNKVGPGPEGQTNPGPTLRLRGSPRRLNPEVFPGFQENQG